MAGAYLTIGAKFRPFSYDELIKPVSQMAAVHAQIDEKLGELQEKAGVWENLANKETDHESYIKYKEYADALKAQAEDLAKNGLNPQSLRQLMNMRARYSNDIVPIEQAYTRRRQLADEQRKMQLQNPTLKFQRDMSTTSLDDLVKNPELDYGYSVNGAAVAQQAGQAFAHLAKSIQEEPQYKHILNNQYWQSMTRAGYSPSQILALSVNSDEAPAELKAIAKQVYDSTGVEDFISKNYADNPNSAGAQEWRDYVNSYINQGAWNAVGTTAYSTVADPYAVAMAKAKASASKGSGSSGVTSRSDASLFGTKGKKQGNTEHVLGTKRVEGEANSKHLFNVLASAYANQKNMKVVDGYNKDGKLEFRDKKYKKLDEKNSDIIGVQIDYETGDMYVSVKEKGSNDIESIAIPKGSNVLDVQSQDALNKWLELSRANDIALAAGRIDDKYYASYKESIKDAMFNIMMSIFDYAGALNTNTDAGEKRSAARNAGAIGDLDWDYSIEE